MELGTRRVVMPYEGTGQRDWDAAAPIDAPLVPYRAPVASEWVDYNGHMSESCYLLVVGHNSDAFFRYIGIGEDYRAAGHTLFTVETHIHNRAEAIQGDPLRMTLQLLDHDELRLHVFHEMRNDDTDALLATTEQLLVHVDARAGRAAPLPGYLTERLAQIMHAHEALSVPETVGRPMGIRRPSHTGGNRWTSD